MKRWRLLCLPLLIAATGCNFPAPGLPEGADAGPGPRAWIDRPLESDRVVLGERVPIHWHAADVGGLGPVEVRINGEVVYTSSDTDTSSQLADQEFDWNPTEVGEYLIEVVPSDSHGNVGPIVDKRITVLAEGGIVEGAVYADLNEDEDADDPGEGPLEGVTVVLAECTEKLSQVTAANGAFRFEGLPFGTDCRMDFDRPGWRTTGTFPTAIDLPIHVSPRLDPAVFSVFLSPVATPTPTLTPTPTASRTPTPSKTPTPLPPDKTPPPKPQIVSPDGVILGCLDDIVLRWSEVSDPSGIDYYEVVLKVDTGGANFVTVGTWQSEAFTAINVNDQTDCGGTYGWSVRTRDNAGNWSQADYALFGIDLP